MCNKEWQTCDVCGQKYIDKESDICPHCQDELNNQLAEVSIPQDIIEYQANGIVLGRLWGGGLGSYRAQDYAGFKNLGDLKEVIKKDFESDALDSGFGFEKLVGARMGIDKRTVKIIDGDRYVNIKHEIFELGDMSKYDEADEEYGLIF